MSGYQVGVEQIRAAIQDERAAVTPDGDEVWLLFTGDLPPDFHDALHHADNVHFATHDYELYGHGPVRLDDGVAVWVSAGGKGGEHLVQWAQTVADGLTQRGSTGTVSVAPRRFLPWPPDVPPDLVVFLGYPDATTRFPGDAPAPAVSTILNIVRIPGADSYVGIDSYGYLAQNPPDLVVANALRDGNTCSVQYLCAEPVSLGVVNFELDGRVALGRWDPALTWQQQLQHATASLLAARSGADIGFVRRASLSVPSWGSVEENRGRQGRANRPFPPQAQRVHLPDAEGVMLLTDGHLARAHDLTDWTLTPVGTGQHLVVATHTLDSWYGLWQPDPAVVEKARRDLGAMLAPLA